MPDRDYYLDPSPRMAEIRTRYQAHIAAVLKLAGVADGDAKAARIFELETKIAEAHASREDSEDVQKGNNHWTRQDFGRRAPGLDWEAFFSAPRARAQPTFVVWQPGAVTGIAALVASQPLETWKDYLTFHAIEHASSFLPKAFVDEAFAFYGKALSGTPKLRDRWKRARRRHERRARRGGRQALRRALLPARGEGARRGDGQERRRRVRPPHRRARLDGPADQGQAKAKLAVLKVGVGYPDKWRDYSALEVVRGDAFGNAERAELFEYRRNLRKLGQPVDRGEWVMNPQLVNAVNLPAMNALNFPAAILQPPYFDPARPAVMDYGAIGAVIGHEISHSFDDQGALFDATGRLENWWTKEDFAHFQGVVRRSSSSSTTPTGRSPTSPSTASRR